MLPVALLLFYVGYALCYGGVSVLMYGSKGVGFFAAVGLASAPTTAAPSSTPKTAANTTGQPATSAQAPTAGGVVNVA